MYHQLMICKLAKHMERKQDPYTGRRQQATSDVEEYTKYQTIG